jgi:thymidylate kinase
VQVFSEDQTHEPIMQDKSSTNTDFFKSILSKIDERAEVVIFDRLYLTQAFRAKVDLDEYSEIEKSLSAFNPITIFLKVDEETIAERISAKSKMRGAEWEEYFKSKGKTAEEIADYYIQQQRSQLKLLEKSILPYKIFNTTTHDYKNIASNILKFIQ